MSTLRVEQQGEDLIVRITPEAQASLGLRVGEAIVLARSSSGEVSLSPADMDHKLRHDRGRAFLRRLRDPI
jgi:hypothetical protein